MKLWILEPQKDLPDVQFDSFADIYKQGETKEVFWKVLKKEQEQDEANLKINPWLPWYDKCFTVVVRAKDEKEARMIASEHAADEGKEAWLDDRFSICKELIAESESGIIIQDIWEA